MGTFAGLGLSWTDDPEAFQILHILCSECSSDNFSIKGQNLFP